MHYNAAWTTFTPTWTCATTAPAIGNGTLTGRYIKVGRLVICHYKFVAGSTTTFGTGNWMFSLPFDNATTNYPTNHHAVGTAYLEDLATSGYDGFLRIVSTYQNKIWINCFNATGTYYGDSGCTNTVPFTWASGDYIMMEFMYEASS